MKKILLAVSIMFTASLFSSCETARQVMEGVNTAYGGAGGLTNTEIVTGLKQALTIGTQNSAQKLSSVDGFFKNAAIKILLPEEAKKVESTLRSLGMNSLVDRAILSINRAAEEAASGAGTIFVNAVQQMTITDAVSILKGGNFAATEYFKAKTTDPLADAFKPVIDKALQNVNATKHWTDVTTAYNQLSNNKINTDLSTYVTQKAIEGIFYQVGLEEQKIRKDPVARTTEILRKVFGSQLAQGS
jgi:nitrogen regulatory protein PII